jgi:hypothetical protein
MKAKTNYLFDRIPNRLMKAHTLLDNIDRGLLGQIISWHPNSCIYSVDYLTEIVLVCGEKAFYRSVYKLQMLGLIEFKRGHWKAKKRRNSNQYTFVCDPSLWRLPKPLSDLIKADHEKLGLGELIYKNPPYANELGFKLAFNSTYPKYQIKIKAEAPKEEILSPTEQAWAGRLDLLTSIHSTPAKVIADFYKFKSEILKLSLENCGFGKYEQKFFEELKKKFDSLVSNSIDEDTFALLNLGNKLDNDGNNADEIQNAIRSESKRQRQAKTEFQ